MRALFLLTLLTLPVYCQNPAPVKDDQKSHVTPAQQGKAAAQADKANAAQNNAPAPAGKPVVLDSVVAIINGEVLLQSDVEQERRFESLQLLPASENTDQRAAEHLITRTLILQQMREQDLNPPAVSGAELQKSLGELKKQLPGCQNRCGTEAGWAAYLQERGLSPQVVDARWRQRIQVFNFLNERFRAGVRVPNDQVQAYYDKELAPQFAAKHERPPTLKALRPRIEEILLQQQVTKQIDSWEGTLRQEGSVQILVPAYGQSNQNAEEASDIPGGAL